MSKQKRLALDLFVMAFCIGVLFMAININRQATAPVATTLFEHRTAGASHTPRGPALNTRTPSSEASR